MARPRIRPSARKIPISISVSPALADKIDEYSHQIRFSRSKFLAQAVTEAINKIELRHDLDDNDYRNFSDDRMLMLAKVRLDGTEEINPTILKQLKDAIKSYEDRTATTQEQQESPQEPSIRWGEDFQFVKIQGASLSTYMVAQLDEDRKRIPIGQIQRHQGFARKWTVTVNREIVGMANSLKDAKAYFTEGIPLVGV
jgi:hypothetical protein